MVILGKYTKIYHTWMLWVYGSLYPNKFQVPNPQVGKKTCFQNHSREFDSSPPLTKCSLEDDPVPFPFGIFIKFS